MLWTPLALVLQQSWLMELSNEQGQTNKFNFQTAEQFYVTSIFKTLVFHDGGAESNEMTSR